MLIVYIIAVFVLLIVISIYYTPTSLVLLFGLKLTKYRLYIKNSTYYLQVRLFWRWYYISKNSYSYSYDLTKSEDYLSIEYPDNMLVKLDKDLLLEEINCITGFFEGRVDI